MTVSDYSERLIANEPEEKPSRGREWVACSLCDVRLKAPNVVEHMSKAHLKGH